jgi:GT2 family glycosyltransferase
VQVFPGRAQVEKKVTVIIPYNKDRGWLQQAIDSIPKGVQVILSKGDGSWTQNFNKGLEQATGEYIRWLHEDDMLTPNCIEDSLATFEETGADFIHGNAIEFRNGSASQYVFRPKITYPTKEQLLSKNVIHSTSLMYHRSVFERVGKMDESLNTAEEFEFNLRCLAAGLKIGYCNSPLAYYRRHSRQKVRVVPTQEKNNEREMVRNKYRA